jgi:hypothetical protein
MRENSRCTTTKVQKVNKVRMDILLGKVRLRVNCFRSFMSNDGSVAFATTDDFLVPVQGHSSTIALKQLTSTDRRLFSLVPRGSRSFNLPMCAVTD